MIHRARMGSLRPAQVLSVRPSNNVIHSEVHVYRFAKTSLVMRSWTKLKTNHTISHGPIFQMKFQSTMTRHPSNAGAVMILVSSSRKDRCEYPTDVTSSRTLVSDSTYKNCPQSTVS